MTTIIDDFFMDCPYCDYRIVRNYDGKEIMPSQVISMHRQMIRHIQNKHQGRRPERR